jgi:hypothetical protein
MTREIHINDVWKRRVELHDPFDVIRVVGLIDHAGQHANEWTIRAEGEFGPTIGTAASGILDHCDLVSRVDAEADWETDAV